MIEVTIYEGEFEDIHLAKYVDKVKYFDSIKEQLVRGAEVRYRDYLLRYKKKHGNATLYSILDYDDTPLYPYVTKQDLVDMFNLRQHVLESIVVSINSQGYRDYKGYRIIKADNMA